MQHQPVFKLHPVRLPVEPPLASVFEVEIAILTMWHVAVAGQMYGAPPTCLLLFSNNSQF